MVLMYGKTVFSYQLESAGNLLLSAEEMPTPCGSKEMLLTGHYSGAVLC